MFGVPDNARVQWQFSYLLFFRHLNLGGEDDSYETRTSAGGAQKKNMFKAFQSQSQELMAIIAITSPSISDRFEYL